MNDTEKEFMRHISMFGLAGYPIERVGRNWHWVDFLGVRGGSPSVYRTKKAAIAAVQRYIDILCDKAAGRL